MLKKKLKNNLHIKFYLYLCMMKYLTNNTDTVLLSNILNKINY